MQVIVQLLLDEIVDEGPYGGSIRPHALGPEFCFGLGFKNRLLNPDGYCRHDALSDIRSIEILFEKLPYGFYHSLPEGSQMRPPLGGKLPVYKGIILFAILIGMRNGHLNIITFKVDNRVSPAF